MFGLSDLRHRAVGRVSRRRNPPPQLNNKGGEGKSLSPTLVLAGFSGDLSGSGNCQRMSEHIPEC